MQVREAMVKVRNALHGLTDEDAFVISELMYALRARAYNDGYSDGFTNGKSETIGRFARVTMLVEMDEDGQIVNSYNPNDV